MVKIMRPRAVQSTGGLVAIAVGTIFVLSMAISNTGTATYTQQSLGDLFDPVANAAAVKAWRANLKAACLASTSLSQMQEAVAAKFAAPSIRVAQPRTEQALRRCANVVLDFGANIGDTSGHVIDTGLKSCDRSEDLQLVTEPTHFNTETREFETIRKRNMLTKNIEKLMELQAGSDTVGPEDYCYYGIEGNPHFTERLQKIEDFVMALTPRPIQHMHFLTESVGAGADGPTKLYLDTVNTEQNFWGSSIFKDHQDVRKSAEAHDGNADMVAADVMGYTVGTLMQKTLSYYDDSKIKSHLILKVDIEGGEYPLLHQAVDDGTLCAFVKAGNTADLFIEFHTQRVTGKHDYVGQTKKMKETLTDCGVNLRNLAAWWA